MKKILGGIVFTLLLVLISACTSARTADGKKIGRLKRASIVAVPVAKFDNIKTFCCIVPVEHPELASVAIRALKAQGFRAAEKKNADMLMTIQTSCETTRRLHCAVKVVITKNDHSETVLWWGNVSCSASAAYSASGFYPDLCRAAVQFAGREYTGSFSAALLLPLPAE